jgi:hypothetical protein
MSNQEYCERCGKRFEKGDSFREYGEGRFHLSCWEKEADEG